MQIQNKKLNTDYRILNTKSGFTLIETLIAITVLLLSITAPLHIASQALFASFYSRDEITAYYLAEEAIEYIKNARDTKFLSDVFNSSGAAISDDAWLDGLENCVKTIDRKGCKIDATQAFVPGDNPNPNAVIACAANSCSPILYNDTGYTWSYISGDESKFTRIIELKPQANNNDSEEEALIEVTVEWLGNNVFAGAKRVFLTSVMTNWQRK